MHGINQSSHTSSVKYSKLLSVLKEFSKTSRNSVKMKQLLISFIIYSVAVLAAAKDYNGYLNKFIIEIIMNE